MQESRGASGWCCGQRLPRARANGGGSSPPAGANGRGEYRIRPYIVFQSTSTRGWAHCRGESCIRPLMVLQAAEKPVCPVIPRSPPFLLADDEESRTALRILRARFLAEFTLSEMRRSFAPLRMTANGLGMTAWRGFSAACLAHPSAPWRTSWGEHEVLSGVPRVFPRAWAL